MNEGPEILNKISKKNSTFCVKVMRKQEILFFFFFLHVLTCTYFSPLLLLEHRPPIISFHGVSSVLSYLSSCFHLCPVLLMTLSSSHCQVFCGLPPYFDLGGSSSGLNGQCYRVAWVVYGQGIPISFVGCPLLLQFAASLPIRSQWILRILRKH